ncbi:hypothetical protein B0919_16600 [Hymenobacter sp. CRA2]|nr:hypothetical protein B0919_16600 [Hymenobacter sp. CRA2]
MQRDAVSLDGYPGPILQLGYANHPELKFLLSPIYVPDIPVGSTYMAFSLGRSTPADQCWWGYSPGGPSASYVAVASQYGAPRFQHTNYYSGHESILPYGGEGATPNYVGQEIRCAARFRANRDPECIVLGNGFPCIVNANYIKGAFPASSGPLYLGGYAYGSIIPASEAYLSTLLILGGESVSVAYDVDLFIRDQFNMFS